MYCLEALDWANRLWWPLACKNFSVLEAHSESASTTWNLKKNASNHTSWEMMLSTLRDECVCHSSCQAHWLDLCVFSSWDELWLEIENDAQLWITLSQELDHSPTAALCDVKLHIDVALVSLQIINELHELVNIEAVNCNINYHILCCYSFIVS